MSFLVENIDNDDYAGAMSSMNDALKDLIESDPRIQSLMAVINDMQDIEHLSEAVAKIQEKDCDDDDEDKDEDDDNDDEKDED